MPVGATTVSVRVTVWESEPDCPLMSMLEAPRVASAAAVKVRVCGVPGVSVSVEGVMVTPVVGADSETLTGLVNPFEAVADTVVCWPKSPVVRVRVVGLRVREKSVGGAAVTLSEKVVVCESELEVPARVMVLELAGAVVIAVRVMVCGAPGVRVTDVGAAVTPVGRPEIVITTGEMKPLIAVAVTVTCWDFAPAVIAMVAGAAEREKSAITLDVELQPMMVKARPMSANRQRLKLRMRELELVLMARV